MHYWILGGIVRILVSSATPLLSDMNIGHHHYESTLGPFFSMASNPTLRGIFDHPYCVCCFDSRWSLVVSIPNRRDFGQPD